MTKQIILFPHQELGADFLVERDIAGLFFGMGTGKTITALEGAKRAEADRVVVVGPPISLPMWQAESERHLGLEATIIKTGKTPLPMDGVLVVSYNIATTRAKELGEWLSAGLKSIVIFDESHALKNVDAKRTKAMLGKEGMTDGTVDHQWHLTGTPITKWNDDLYPFLSRADLKGMKKHCGGTHVSRFRRTFCVQQERMFGRKRAWLTVGNRNTQQLAEWVYKGGHALRVDLDEVFKDMPPLTTNAYTIGLDKKAMSEEALERLKELQKSSVSDIQKAQKAGDPALATIRRELGLGMVKEFVQEAIARIESGQNVLIGAWHTDVIDRVAAALRKAGYEIGVIDGRVSMDNKTKVEKAWNNGELNAVVGQIAAMGVSLNLQQGGSQIMIIEEDWSPTIMDQFYARLWRFGQKKHVHVDIFRADTKLHQAMARIASVKASQAEKHNQIGREETKRLDAEIELGLAEERAREEETTK